jgi:hypothetical protein
MMSQDFHVGKEGDVRIWYQKEFVMRPCRMKSLERSSLLFVVCLLAMLVSSGPAGSAQPPEVVIVAEEYAFSGPERIDGGWKTIRFTNQGHEIHHVQFLKLPAEKTSKEFNEALASDSTRLPSWVVRYGGVNSVMPGEEANVIINLDPGEYVLICGIPDKRGLPHVIRGMSKSLQVTSPNDEPADGPAADVKVSMKEFNYSFDGPLTAGERMILVRNDGTQAHELLLLKLAPGASVRDFWELYEPGILGNPAGRTIGGLTGLSPGREAFLPLHVEPGRYGILCFLADPRRRTPHFMAGMWMDIDVPSAAAPATP